MRASVASKRVGRVRMFYSGSGGFYAMLRRDACLCKSIQRQAVQMNPAIQQTPPAKRSSTCSFALLRPLVVCHTRRTALLCFQARGSCDSAPLV
jgi:hypothetical protein